MAKKQNIKEMSGDGLAFYKAAASSGIRADLIFKAMGVSNGTYYKLFDKAIFDSDLKESAASALGKSVEEVFGEVSTRQGVPSNLNRLFAAPMVTEAFLLEKLRQGHSLNYEDSVELRLISDFAARLVIEGRMDSDDRGGHVDMLMEYAKLYLTRKKKAGN